MLLTDIEMVNKNGFIIIYKNIYFLYKEFKLLILDGIYFIVGINRR
jgi:hypothetical protein